MTHWSGSVDFLNGGSAKWTDHRGLASLVTWKFAMYPRFRMPFYLFSCRINAWGISAVGCASSITREDAAKKSFAEAWERLWMKTISQTSPSCAPLQRAQSAIHLSSNGFAAGETSEMARKNARFELVERAILLQAWQNMQGWQRRSAKGTRSKLIEIAMAARGWKTFLFNLKSNCGDAMACLLLNSKLGALFDVTLCEDPIEAEYRLFNSVITSSFARKKNGLRNTLPFRGGPRDHFSFYSNPSNLPAFDFLTKTKISKSCCLKRDRNAINSTSIIQLPDPEKIVTQELVSAGLFPAVARSFNPEWPELSWGSISIKGLNQWPHPLA